MGYNTTVLFLNDAANELERDPLAGRKIYEGIMTSQRGKQVDICLGNHVNAATVLAQHHADETQILAVGGNCGSLLYRGWGAHHTPEHQVRLLKDMADSLGFNLVKKRSK